MLYLRIDSKELERLSVRWYTSAIKAPMPSKKVVSVGADSELLWLRNYLLKSAGFEVATTQSHDDALSTIERGDCGTLLMCYSLARTVRQSLAEAFGKHCPDGRIIAITNMRLEEPDFADRFVYGVEGPEALIDAISSEGIEGP